MQNGAPRVTHDNHEADCFADTLGIVLGAYTRLSDAGVAALIGQAVTVIWPCHRMPQQSVKLISNSQNRLSKQTRHG